MDILEKIRISQFKIQVRSLGLKSGLSDTVVHYALSELVTNHFKRELAAEKSEPTEKGEENDC